MSWVALILTLLLEQVRAVPSGNPVYAGAAAWADKVAHNLNAGRPRHGAYGWLLVVGTGMLATLVVFEAARSFSWFAGLAIDVCVLFFALGFRQFSHPITLIQTALEQGDLDEARRVFAAWRRKSDPQFDAAELAEGEIARQAIEYGLLAAHRHVFGVLLWFLILPGPSGAVLYRFSEYLSRRWNRAAGPGDMPPDRFGEFAQQIYAWIDWLPVRFSALGFAIVGDFEGAVHCWRNLNTDSRPSILGGRTLIWPRPAARWACASSAPWIRRATSTRRRRKAPRWPSPGRRPCARRSG